ncbi:MAG: protein kinase domain-containing protein [Actinomycetota bacterium]
MTVTPTAARTASDLAGTVLGARYALRGLLGRGGMGEVYEAADLRLDRTVAVKVLRPELAADRRFVARFEREARTAARLQHPGIVAVFDVGEDGGRVFTVLEHVPGRTLAELLRAQSRLAPAEVASIGADVADALAHAHARGVVHRDVAPGNVMVRVDGVVKVLDFGIARALQGSGLGTSVTAHGTVAYAAPEVLRGEPGDQRVDVYGLGAVLYELLVGAPPFSGRDDAAVEARLAADAPPPLRAIEPSVPPGLEETVLRCLARDPAGRDAHAGRLAAELRRLAAFLPTTTPAPIPPPDDTTTDRLRTPVATTVMPAPAGRRRRRPPLLVAALLAAVLGAAALIVGPSLLALRDPVAARVAGPPSLPAPTGLAAGASCDGFLSAGVDLSWGPVPGATGYQIWRRGTSGEPWTQVTQVGAGATALRDHELGLNAFYVYRVRGLDGPLPGRWSAPTTARTPGLCLT